MDLLSPRPFWPLKDGLPTAFPPLERNASTQVAVIGGGITGALMAWHLAEAGIDAIVVDRREVAHGSTAGSTALLQYEIDVPLYRLKRRIGPERARRAYHGCLGAVERIGRLVKRLKLDCGFAPKGSLLLARDRASVAGLRREFLARRDAGFAVDWWSRHELGRRSSLPQPAALFSKAGQAAQVDAYALAYGLLAGAVARGARVHDRTTVLRHRATARGVELFTDRGARLRARWLVLASGYEADQFLPRRFTALHSTYALASEPIANFPGWPVGLPVIWETGDPYLYLRTTGDHRVIMGGYDEPFRDPIARDRLIPLKVAALRRRFARLFPRLPLEVATAWAGTFGQTADGLPFIGEHRDHPRTWFALGYGGNGITYSLIAAELFRDFLATGKARDLDLYGFERTENL
ncbi:MAG TPA: FAD-dependent oxidoreductase [Lacunisphaera sp.]|nr:FAD-dependent oxidoreductase [Lacunisphaera sp.]